MRRAVERLLLSCFFVAASVVGASCILGPKQDDPDTVYEDTGTMADTAKSNPDDGGFNTDTGVGPFIDAGADAPPFPPDDRCGDPDAADAAGDAPEGGCDAPTDAPDADAHDAHDGEIGPDVVTGG